MNTASKKNFKRSGPRSENPDPVDIYVGLRLRMRRNLVGLSQGQLGKSLGLTFQQIQKYECGVNRMGSSRLYQIAKILSVPVMYFFEEMPESLSLSTQFGFTNNKQCSLKNAPLAERQNDCDILRRRETLELVRAYYRIEDTKQRRKMYELICSIANKA